MSTIRIKKGHHYPTPFIFPRFFFGKKFDWASSMRVTFNNTCAYEIGEDQSDINKLFGISYGHHQWNNSDRIGWRYLPGDNKIELLLYSYVDGQRVKKPLTKIPLNKEFKVAMLVSLDGNKRFVSVHIEPSGQFDSGVPLGFSWEFEMKPCLTWLHYTLHPYFGGNCKAPHDITIENRSN